MITIKVDGQQAEQMMRGLVAGVEDFTPVWPKVEQLIMNMETEQFESEGEYGGEKWEPLNDSYAEYKRRSGGDQGILVSSGVGRASLTTRGKGHYYNAGPNFVEVGTSIPYMSYHQRGNANLPKRVVVPVPPKDVGSEIRFALLAHVFLKMNQAVKGAGR